MELEVGLGFEKNICVDGLTIESDSYANVVGRCRCRCSAAAAAAVLREIISLRLCCHG